MDCLKIGRQICLLNKILPKPSHSFAGQIGLAVLPNSSTSKISIPIKMDLRPRSKKGVFGNRLAIQRNDAPKLGGAKDGMPQVNS
jgi:hypothetical protein